MLFLKEVQVKLLRVLEAGVIEKVGDHAQVPVDVRIISATHRNLTKMVDRDEFRLDLFYRLNIIPIEIPPLRERITDIPLLVHHFLDRPRDSSQKPLNMAPSALDLLMNHGWPGNVRELENTMERLVVFARDKTITSQDLMYSNTVLSQMVSKEPVRLKEMERQHIMKVLGRTKGNKTHAAELLGIDRKTLRIKLKKYEISLTAE